MSERSTSHTAGRRDASRPRRWPLLLLGIVAVLFGVLAAAPTLLSTALGRDLLVSAVNERVRGTVGMDALSLGWLSGQRIDGLTVRDPEDRPVLRVESFTSELTLLEAARMRLDLGVTRIAGLAADIVVDADGNNNLGRALQARDASPAESAAPIVVPVTTNFELAPARVSVTAPGMDPVVFEPLTATVKMPALGQPIEIDVRGESRQGELTGAFSLTGAVSGLVGANGRLDLEAARGALTADVRDLPVDGVDRLLGLKGLATAALGERANLQVLASGTAAEQTLTVTGGSPHSAIDLKGRVAQTVFALTEPATVKLNVTPALVDALVAVDAGTAASGLRETFGLNMTVDRLQAPLAGFDPSAIAVALKLDTDRPVRLAGGDQWGEVVLREVSASLDAERLTERVTFALGGDAVTQESPGRFSLTGSVSDLFSGAGVLQLDKLRIDAQAELRDVPTVVIDRLAAQGGMLVDLLGDKLNLGLAATSSGGNRIDATLDVDAGPLQAQTVAVRVEDDIGLSQPARLQYRLSPAAVRRVLGTESAVALQRPATLALEVGTLTLPRPKAGEPVFQPGKIAFKATLTSDPLIVDGVVESGPVQVGAVRAELDADTLRALRLGLNAEVSEPKRGVLADLGAAPITLALTGTTGVTAQGGLEPLVGRVELSGPGLAANVPFNMAADLTAVTLAEPGELRWLVGPELLQWFGVGGRGQPTLAEPVWVAAKLDALELPLAPFSWTGVEARIDASVDELLLDGTPAARGVALRDTVLSAEFAGARNRGAVKLHAQTTAPGGRAAGTVAVDATFEGLMKGDALDLGGMKLDGQVNISQLPTALVEALSGQGGWSALVGDSLDVAGTAATRGQAETAAALTVTAARLNAELGLNVTDAVTLTKPGQLRLTLTPNAYAGLMNLRSEAPAGDTTASWALAEDAVIEATVEQLRWPLKGSAEGGFDPSRAGVVADLRLPRLVLRDTASKRTVAVESLQATVSGQRLDQPLAVAVTGQVRGAETGGGAPGSVSVTARAADLFSRSGTFNTDGLSIDLDGQIQQLPVALIDEFLAAGGLSGATLGTTADLRVQSRLKNMQGPFSLTMRADNATLQLKSKVQAKTIVLIEPLTAEVKATPLLGKQVLAKVHPIFETTDSGEQPIRLEVPHDGVRIPIDNFDLKKVVVPRISLDFGKITLQSGWLLKGIVGLAQQFDALDGAGREQWQVWFTPALLELRDGRIRYSRRLDLLLDQRLHLATWGVADLARDRADLVLAFMPDTLERVFSLTAAEGDALRMPIEGPLSSPKMDFKQAAVELGRLRAQERLAKKEPLAGALAGALTSRVTGGASGTIPAASVEPLPWGPLPQSERAPDTQADRAPAEEPSSAPEKRKSTKEQAIESLIDLLRKPK